jgi:hypothetical protein
MSLAELVDEPVAVACWPKSLRQVICNPKNWMGVGACWPSSLRQVVYEPENWIGLGLLPMSNQLVKYLLWYAPFVDVTVRRIVGCSASPLFSVEVISVQVDLLWINVS